MKNLHITFSIILIVFFVQITPVHALMRATFPDSKSLQPMTENVYPNISGNTNSTVQSGPIAEEYPEEIEIPKAPSQEVVTTENKSDRPNYLLWTIGILALLTTGFIFYFKKRKV